MKKIRIAAILLLMIFSSTSVNASTLGSTLIDGYTIEIGKGTTSTHNKWYSDQSGVGQQVENYITYKPNEHIEPIITHGEYLYGAGKISDEVSRLRNNGINSIAGINADYFSLQTGLPMSNIISDSKIITKTEGPQYGIGILEDNTAFMSEFTLYSTLYKDDETVIAISNINKLRQPYSIYMLTNDFGTQTYNTTNGYDVILTDIEGEIKIGSEIKATVESVDEYNGSIAIPEGKIVLTVDANAPEEYVQALTSLQIGEEIKITFGFEGDERWENVKLGIGATGEVLIENGTVYTEFTAGAHPRTAMGIKEDGSIIFYTIDGRQKGYSYGVQLKTLAKRMSELGCVDAINLDGGGSTSYIVQLPGDATTTLINKPSDGKLRNVSNFFFLKNNQEPTGILDKITVYPLTSYVLVGNSVQISAKGSDTASYPVKLTNITYSVDKNSKNTITEKGYFTANEDGTATIYAKSKNITGNTDIVCVDKPTIKVMKENGASVDNITINREKSLTLKAEAYKGYNKLIASDKSFKWSCDEVIGTITDNGVFTATDSITDVSGNIYVTAGKTTVKIPVNVKGLNIIYNPIDIDVENDLLTVNLNTNEGLPVEKDNIIIKADGKKIDFEYKNGIATVAIDESINKITVFATNSEGFTSFKTKVITANEFDNPFADTSEHWAKDVLSYMYSAKIVNGEIIDNSLKFNPGKSMTRSEFAVMTTNYLGIDVTEYSDVELPYTDADKIPQWALNSFKALYELGVVKGSDNNGKLYANPTDSITRAETATIISRTLPNGLKKAEITSSDKNDIKEWFTEGFEILINIGAINGYEDGTILPNKNVTKAEAAKILYTIL